MKCIGTIKQYIKMHKGELLMYDICIRRESYTVGNERKYNHNEFYGVDTQLDVHDQYSKIRKEFLASLK